MSLIPKNHGEAAGIGAEGFGGAFFVEDIKLGDRKARIFQQVDNRAGEVAAAEEALLQRFDAVLRALYRFAGCQSMFEEVQGCAGCSSPAQLR